MGSAPAVHDRPSPDAEAVNAIFQEDGAYARWRWWLDRFGAGEDHPMEGLVLLGEGAGLVTMQRLAEESVGAMNRRFGVWSRNLQRDMNAAAALGNRAYGQLQVVLVNGRRALVPMFGFARTELLVAEIRTALGEMLTTGLADYQRNQEDWARRQGREGEHLLRLLREHPMTRAEHLAPPVTQPQDSSTPTRTRRVIL